MKRLIAAGVLLIVVTLTYFSSVAYIKHTYNETSELLEDCITAYNNKKGAETAAKKLGDYWDKHEQNLSIFANHGRIDEIELAISSIEIYSKTEEKEIFSEYTGTVKTLLHQLLEDTLPSFHSIL